MNDQYWKIWDKIQEIKAKLDKATREKNWTERAGLVEELAIYEDLLKEIQGEKE